MLWVKTLHVFFIVSWFAGLFYLPRLFVNHASKKDTVHHELLLGMEQRLLKMMDFTLFFVLVSGVVVLYLYSSGFETYYFQQKWIHAKLTLVVVLIGYHHWCRIIHQRFKTGKEYHSHRWFRIFNELPVFILIPILYLVVAKPF